LAEQVGFYRRTTFCIEHVVAGFSPRLISRKLPSLVKEGWLRPVIECREASLAGADGVVGSSHELSVVERTTPSAPSNVASRHFLDVASTPPFPRRGVCQPAMVTATRPRLHAWYPNASCEEM
jgi:hypothetical protein